MEPIRGQIWTDRLVKAGYRPPRDVARALRQVFPMVRLEYAHDIERWSLWEDLGGGACQLIAAIAGPDGEYEHPNMDNTIQFLGDICVADLAGTGDRDRWLAELDAHGEDGAKDAERRGQERIHEGSERLYHALAKTPFLTMNPEVSVR